MPTGPIGGIESPDAKPGTSVGGWRSLTHALARTSPAALTASGSYRRAALRQLAAKRKVVR